MGMVTAGPSGADEAPKEVVHSQKLPLLFLCHRIPYPPNKGDKIRSFHLLHHLSQHFDIHLGSFVDDPEDWPWVAELEKYCASVFLRPLYSRLATLRSLWGFLGGQALSVPYYRDRKMLEWAESVTVQNDLRHAIVYSSSMAQFLPAQGANFERKVIDFVDVDSDKWRQYASQKPWPLNWVYHREARCLLALEQALAKQFDAGLFVSSAEADLFHQLSPDTAHKIGFYNNGVNCDYFDPAFDADAPELNPYPEGSVPLVFTGAMDYWPNVDAVVWFVHEVLPLLRGEYPQVTFTIVGGSPARAVRQLARQPGVAVTGRVPDVRPYLKYAIAAVAPMRIARGVQNKVLEAMAMARPVLVSEKGLEGIAASDGDQVLLAESSDDYGRLIGALLKGDYPHLGERARQCVLSGFSWQENLPEVVLLLGGESRLPRYARGYVDI
ncbi:MAG: TIGR03087 family PEP-CTERM/XrtA system glycosyltransferase [Halieaceae bacterium]|uniref:TIGR03087 family PEP-CTERM/XrtA system glycosyltransferase n=1 Tax=Haliea alexandrii TaxID=2448162 RepID=UPI0018EEA89D|nr:TIGR03087 family PEP-CTERM/XrtA system glycosyltransferase [Haliea alexandrii]MCR9186189.1 TIGR03087 family PEP-CTERM/XrtA system glycosyltransferase [Halieaceae bacterium]